MVDYKEILRLSDQGYSQRQIETSVGSSRHTISEVLETANTKGIKWLIEDDVSNEDLQSILFPEKYASTSGYMEPDYEYIHAELAKPGVTLTLLWTEYNEKSAIIYSLAATAAANGIPVEQYFTDFLRHPQIPPMPWN